MTHRRGARKTGGGKAPVSPKEVSKLVADVIPVSVNPLEQENDDDTGEELDLRRDKDERKVISDMQSGAKVYLLNLRLLVGKEQQKSQKRRIVRGTVIFNRFQIFFTITFIT